MGAVADKRLGKYTLLAKLASGGMGEIFLARLAGESGFEKLLVIKRLLPALVAEEEFVTMFLREARIAAQLSHSNICDVYELGHEDDQYFIAMQHLQGVPFSAIAKLDPGSDERRRLRLVVGLIQQACAGLHHAHELEDVDGRNLGLVHRDVSPSNLFVTVDGVLKVLDFGIAKASNLPSITSKGTVKGKVAYMSPEQVRGEELDRRSDIYALGVVLFEAVTRRRLFQRESEFLVAKAVLEEEIPAAHQLIAAVPAPLSAVIQKATSRDARHRYATARQFADAIATATTALGEPLTAAEIADLIAATFATELEDQRESARTALRGDSPAPAPIAVPERATASYAPPPTVDDEATVPERPARRPAPRRARRLGIALALGLALSGLALAYHSWPASSPSPASPRDAMANPAADAGAARTPLPLDAADPDDAGSADAAMGDAGLEPDSGKPGFFSVDSTPYATIYIDGRRVDDTPLIRHELPPGRHRVRAVLADGRSRSFTIVVESERQTPPRQLYW